MKVRYHDTEHELVATFRHDGRDFGVIAEDDPSYPAGRLGFIDLSFCSDRYSAELVID
jgi:hypothetical protein